MTIIEDLEEKLAKWVGKEAALVFSTGMQVNLGTISSIVGKRDIIIMDKEDHASIVDGAFLSGGKIERFRHNDMAHCGAGSAEFTRRTREATGGGRSF